MLKTLSQKSLRILSYMRLFLIHLDFGCELNPLFFLTAVGPFSKVLQIPFPYHAYDDSHGIFWNRDILPCPSF